MKTNLFIIYLSVLVFTFTSCKKDDDSITKISRSETIDMGASYVNDIYYSLNNGIIAAVPRVNWDIAFSVSTRSSSILVNESAGVILKVYPKTWTWAGTIDTSGYKTWATLHNSNTDWEIGAFNANAGAHPNYGWGVYNSVNHNIENADGGALYIIKYGTGTFKKIWIETKFSSLQKYSFRYADLDGSNPQTVSEMSLSGSKANYGYYSLQTNQLIADREPDATTWDLVFTRWYDISMNYRYATGVLQNIGIKAIDLTVDDPGNISYTQDQFSTDMHTIGSYWKVNDPITHLYTIPANKVYVVKDASGKDFAITFKSFVGSSTGVLTFDIKEL